MPPVVVDSVQSLNQFVGTELGVSDWLIVAQERIDEFAAATDDKQWIHIDPERARDESPFGGTIAHGFLTLSLISSFMKQIIEFRLAIRMAVNYGLNRVRFVSPVRSGSRIRGRFRLLSLKDLPGSAEAVFSVTVESEGSAKPNCVAEWVVRYYS
jgi:acyl dehydratase